MMAARPDGKSGATERVVFTRPAAERISKVVRIVEAGDRSSQGLRFERVGASSQSQKTFRICKYTGSWSIGEEKTVAFKYQTTTPNTANVQNLFIPIADLGTAQRDCAIAKEGTAWYLLQVQWDQAMVVTNAVLTQSALEFSRVNSIQLGTASTVQISISTCATATA